MDHGRPSALSGSSLQFGQRQDRHRYLCNPFVHGILRLNWWLFAFLWAPTIFVWERSKLALLITVPVLLRGFLQKISQVTVSKKTQSHSVRLNSQLCFWRLHSKFRHLSLLRFNSDENIFLPGSKGVQNKRRLCAYVVDWKTAQLLHNAWRHQNHLHAPRL